MSRHELPPPDIKIPANNPAELRDSITREWVDREKLLARGSWDTLKEIQQCESNYNDLLDHYPLGMLRTEVVLEQI